MKTKHLDPFFGITKTGKFITRWMNRLLIVGELYFLFMFTMAHLYSTFLQEWIVIPILILAPSIISLVNNTICSFWSFLLVIIHGTTDPDQLSRNNSKPLNRIAR